MVRSETGAAGVMFTLDTESGFRDVVFITASYGLGEMVVQVLLTLTNSTYLNHFKQWQTCSITPQSWF
jgi:phosphoenolpyruvate synthase/pyruvate phosphate dikinase